MYIFASSTHFSCTRGSRRNEAIVVVLDFGSYRSRFVARANSHVTANIEMQRVKKL